MNILLLDLGLQDRLEAITHYSKVLVLDRALKGLRGNAAWLEEIAGELNQVDNQWLNEDSGPRPDATLDQRRCSSIAWQVMLRHLETQRTKSLGGTRGTMMHEIMKLTVQLEAV